METIIKKITDNEIENDKIILLVAFLERGDGDYQKAINVARKRLKWLNS